MLTSLLNDIANGKKLRVAQPSDNDSIISRTLTESVGRSVKAIILLESIGDAIRYPEQNHCAIRIKSITQMDADARSMSAMNDDESDYFYPAPPAWFFEPMSRSSYQLEGHYEVINVFVHILQTTDGKKPDLKASKETIRDDVVKTLNRDFQHNNAHIIFKAMGG